MNFISVIVITLLGEAIWETSKLIWQNGKVNVDRIGALAVSELLAILADLNILSLVGINLSVPFVGVVLTGILISRGTNFTHDLIGNINNLFQSSK